MKIIIEVSGKEYKVTESEARNIYKQLEGLFSEKQLTPFPHAPYMPGPPPMFPQQNTIPYDPWKITCTSGMDG